MVFFRIKMHSPNVIIEVLFIENSVPEMPIQNDVIYIGILVQQQVCYHNNIRQYYS